MIRFHLKGTQKTLEDCDRQAVNGLTSLTIKVAVHLFSWQKKSLSSFNQFYNVAIRDQIFLTKYGHDLRKYALFWEKVNIKYNMWFWLSYLVKLSVIFFFFFIFESHLPFFVQLCFTLYIYNRCAFFFTWLLHAKLPIKHTISVVVCCCLSVSFFVCLYRNSKLSYNLCHRLLVSFTTFRLTKKSSLVVIKLGLFSNDDCGLA